jgi:SagB-type dehydrogenase family enzyme
MKGIEFIEQTRYGSQQEQTDEMKGIQQPEIEEPPFGDTIPLPDPDRETVQELDLSEAIELRESIRDYTEESLSLTELSYLLWCTAGVKWALPGSAFRTVPSAGCCHAIDTYLAVSRVNGLKPGLYRYIALEHSLEHLPSSDDPGNDLSGICFDQPCVREAAVLFIWAAKTYRMTWRYGERGYRNIFLDAGHICQNLYLAVQPVGCGCCAIGAYQDEELNEMFSLDGTDQFVLYLAAVGKIDQQDEEEDPSGDLS